MRLRLVLFTALAAAVAPAAGHAQGPSRPLAVLAAALDLDGYGDVRSLVASGETLHLLARTADGRVVAAVVDGDGRTVPADAAPVAFVRYDEPDRHLMTFRELAGLVDRMYPGSVLTEMKRSQGAYEVHLRSTTGAAVGMLVDLRTRKVLPYHSHD